MAIRIGKNLLKKLVLFFVLILASFFASVAGKMKGDGSFSSIDKAEAGCWSHVPEGSDSSGCSGVDTSGGGDVDTSAEGSAGGSAGSSDDASEGSSSGSSDSDAEGEGEGEGDGG